LSVGDIYETTLKGTLFGQQINNVFFYYQDLEFVTTNPTKAQALVEGFEAQVVDVIMEMITSDYSLASVTARNLFDTSDAYELLLSGGGVLSGGASLDTMTAFTAYGFKLQTEDHSVKPGAKRFAGVAESEQTDGIVTGTTMLSTLAPDTADALAAPIQIGTLITDPVFVPIVVKRVRSGSPGSYSYRLPETSGEAVFSRVVAALFEVLVTSQVTRKIGVGI